MASNTDIANSALYKLGEDPITSLDDDTTKAGRTMAHLFELRRDALIRKYNWSFALTRTTLSALATSPSWGYTYAYQMPVDCLRIVQVNDLWVIPGSADFIGGPDSEPYSIDGREIHSDFSAPLKIRYLKKVTNPGHFDVCFVETLAYDLALEACEAITQSNTKKDGLARGFMEEIRAAIRANAIELPPQAIADDSWIASRF